MVQDQLVEYISSQLKLGVSRDAIKSALTGVGWAPLDVEDTLKKVDGGASAAAAPLQVAVSPKAVETASPAAASPKFVSFSSSGAVAAPGQIKNPEPQAVRVSDLVSSVAPASGASVGVGAAKPASFGMKESIDAGASQKNMPKISAGGTFPAFSASAGVPAAKKKGVGLVEIVIIILAVTFAGLAGYLFFQNNNLNGQLRAMSGQSQGAAQGSAVQVQALNASNTALAAEVASATAMNQDLVTNLSFFVVPVGSPTSVTSTSITVSGILSAGLGKNTYMITTAYGVKVYVKNSLDKNVAAALSPLLGTTVQLGGTYIPGTPNVTVTDVNGSPTTPPVVATSTPASSATSTPVATSTGATTTKP